MNKQYFVRKIWYTIHYITLLYRNDTIHYTECIVPTLAYSLLLKSTALRYTTESRDLGFISSHT